MVQKKVAAAGVAGAFTVIVVWVVEEFAGLQIPAEVASAFTALIAFVAGYLKAN
ncbi:MAG: hypothetical protein ACE5JS_21935 [Nitrospinota bacterium]